ncbi:N-acetylmuramoyl-L-alanine amidase [Priestia flexa]|uniref:N-acetylmuramoyl-L-alanine amidase n=1 Tax=Priestia flexa TaxID=86664 RepID=UPI000473A67C|nr:N-acetylmuramoyl-L-alanine amidase [Priestia flexa]
MTKRLVLDAGHGGKDVGAVGNGMHEADYVLKQVLGVRDYLLANYEGIEIKLTRGNNTFVELSQRAKIANNYNADAFISFHLNASGGKGHGYETFVYSKASKGSKDLQEAIHTPAYNVINSFGQTVANRGKKSANYAVLRLTNMPAVLLETLFIDNDNDGKLLKNDKFTQAVIEQYAKSIAQFLCLKVKDGKTISKPAKIEAAPKVEVKAEVIKKEEAKPVVKPSPIPATPFKGDVKIKDIQSTLNSRYGAKLALDGLYGVATKKALVKGLQTELNKQYGAKLKVDGIFGSAAQAKCPTVREGAKGNITYLIQAMLVCKGYAVKYVDGIYGANMKDMIVKFQRENNLVSDSIVGKKTFEKLFK